MPAEIIRKVNGRLLDRREWIALICDTIDRAVEKFPQGARANDILALWGPQEGIERQDLAIELGRLKRRGVLESTGRGLYKVAANYRENGVTVGDEFASAVRDILVAEGGIMTVTALREAYGAPATHGTLTPLRNIRKRGRPASIDREAYASHVQGGEGEEEGARQFRYRLTSAKGLRRYFGRNLVSLPLSEIARLPLEGRHTALLIGHTMRHLADPNEHDFRSGTWADTVTKEQMRQFRHVGAAYGTARILRQVDAEGAASHSVFGPILERVAATHPWKSAFRNHVDGQKGDYPDAFYALDDATMADWPQVVLWMFEDGDYDTHMAARTDFHVALADMLRINPVFASRGVLSPDHEAEAFTDSAWREAPEGGDEGGPAEASAPHIT